MSGGDTKVSPRCSEKSPRELKAQEGIERWAGLNLLSIATDRYLDQSPGGKVGGSGAGEATRRQESFTNGMRARLVDEASRLGSGENP